LFQGTINEIIASAFHPIQQNQAHSNHYDFRPPKRVPGIVSSDSQRVMAASSGCWMGWFELLPSFPKLFDQSLINAKAIVFS
jgi:hypothetical protein